MAAPKGRLLLFWSIVIVGCAVDLATKSWIFARLGMPSRDPDREVIWVVRPVFSLTTSLNEGALFGLGQGWTFLFAGLSVVAAVGIVYWLCVAGGTADLRLTLALGCILAGIFGNLYDRLGFPGLIWHEPPRVGAPVYAVRDWLHFKWRFIDWPVFNIADSLLVCGAALIFVCVFWPPVDSASSLASQPISALGDSATRGSAGGAEVDN
ncbi:MAG: signal peptidase II [Pirellulales bacterium]